MKTKNIIILLLLLAGAGLAALASNFSERAEPTEANVSLDAPTASDANAEEQPVENASFPKSDIVCETPPETPADSFPKAEIDCDPPQPLSAEAEASAATSLASETWESLPDNLKKEETESNILAGVVEKGDTVSKILDTASNGENSHYISAMRKVFSPGSFREGQPYTVVTDPDSGRLLRFEYEINNLRRLVVEGEEKPRARLEDIQYTTILETCAGIVEDNLFQAVADAGENPQLAVRIAQLFGSEINFVKDLQEGDSFTVLHEKKYRNGHYAGYGRILAARFTNKGKTWEAFLFRDASGREHYYNANGENLKKTLMQAPLAVTRLTSKFSHSRKHPILGTSRPHLGVDYGAPAGTPVKAVGDGVVTKRGWNGGYGNQVILKHTGGLESLYAHLSKFAPGLKPGQKVRQGQVIGYVGSTGLSTGPHLDFRIRQDGVFINPTKAINPRSAPVSPRMMAAFSKAVQQERNYLDGGRLPRKYAVDMLVPQNVASESIAKPERKIIKKRGSKQGRRKNVASSSRGRS